MGAKRNTLVSLTFRLVLVALILGLSAALAVWLVATRSRPVTVHAQREAPRVLVMEARPVPVRRQWEGFGTARAIDVADVPARVTATVVAKARDIRPGRSVQRGELLLKLDDSDFLRQVEIATQTLADIDAQMTRLEVEEQSWLRRSGLLEEELRLAQAELERVRQALHAGAAKQREVDAAELTVAAAHRLLVAAREEFDKVAPRRGSLRAQRLSQEAALRLARQDAERTSIVSPLDGVLQAVDVEEGENVASGQRVARVVNLERIEVALLLPAAARPYLAVDDPVSLTTSGDPPQTWSACLNRTAPEGDPATRTMQAFVEIVQDPRVQPILSPGQFVQGVVESRMAQERWVVPRRAVDGQRVLLIEEGVVRGREVEVAFQVQGEVPALGLRDRQWAVLEDPLPERALVVVDAARTLVEGAPVRPVMAGSGAADQRSVAGAAATAVKGPSPAASGGSP